MPPPGAARHTHAVGDEPAFVGGLNAESLAGARAIFLAGSAESSRQALELLAGQPGAAIIDLDRRRRRTARCPPARTAGRSRGPGRRHGLPACMSSRIPAAIALALFLRRLHAHDAIRRSVIQIFAPASEHGTPGVEELQQQTVSLLSFKNLPHAIFDAQLGFNLLAAVWRRGPAPAGGCRTAHRTPPGHAAGLPGEGEGAPMPSLRLMQAPVFHGYSFSRLGGVRRQPDIEALESGLVTGSIEVRGSDFEAPTNVGQAGQGGIAVGAIAPDRNHPEACWFWLVADNLRLTAENAVAVARQLV